MVSCFVVGTAACTGLPNVTDVLGGSLPVRQPIIVDKEGRVPKAETRTLLNRMEGASGPADIVRKHLAHEEAITGTPLVMGNRVRLLKDGPSTYAAMNRAIEAAKDHVNLETYIFEPDEVGRRMADLLVKKQSEGVQVNVIYDGVGGLEIPPEFFDRLRHAGGLVIEFNPVNPLKAKRRWALNQRDHRKILIVDGKTAFTGGINISGVYSRSPFRSSRPSHPDAVKKLWRDTHIQIEGPVVADFQRIFLQAWAQQEGPPLPERRYFPPIAAAGPEVVRAVNNSPANDRLSIYTIFLSAISHAEQSIHLTVAYFAPDREMLTALTDAAARGIDVTLLLPSVTDAGLILHAGRSHYGTLLQAGVKVYEREHALLHAKTAVIDGVWSTVGSANMDWRSFVHNEEVNAIILGPEFGDEMEALFTQDLADSRPVTLETWRHRPIFARLKEFVARLLEYWL